MWWSIFLSNRFWTGVLLGLSLGIIYANILVELSDPYRSTTLTIHGDVDAIAKNVRELLERLMERYGNSPSIMDVASYSTLDGKEYIFKSVILKHYNRVDVYPTYNYSKSKEVKIYIEGLDRWKIKKEMKKALKAK